MNLFVVGGSGIVGTIVIPFLLREHSITVYDLSAPKVEGVRSVTGNVTDYEALRAAVKGHDALIYMAMGNQHWADWSGSEAAMDVNVKGVHFAMRAAAEAGMTQAVYCSTMSIYANLHHRYFPDEDIASDESNIYGFTKWMGEEVCRNASRRWGINVNALRLCLPMPLETWREKALEGVPPIGTSAEDVARAMLAALRFAGGFQAFMINGDYEQKLMSLGRARKILDWEPLARPAGEPS